MKRATSASAGTAWKIMNFNPRPREEGDFIYIIKRGRAVNFNPRPREEGDPAPVRGSAKPKDFNPRPREEGDGK